MATKANSGFDSEPLDDELMLVMGPPKGSALAELSAWRYGRTALEEEHDGRSETCSEHAGLDGQARQPLSGERRNRRAYVQDHRARTGRDYGPGAAVDHNRPQVRRKVYFPALLRNGRRQLFCRRLEGRRAQASWMVPQYPRQPERRGASRDREDEGARQDGVGRGTPPALGEGAPILAALCRLSTQDRTRDPRRCA